MSLARIEWFWPSDRPPTKLEWPAGVALPAIGETLEVVTSDSADAPILGMIVEIRHRIEITLSGTYAHVLVLVLDHEERGRRDQVRAEHGRPRKETLQRISGKKK